MIKTAHAVIGANWGDEGKGLMTDYFASQTPPEQTIVVRYNGGAQAGHTVALPDGRRHVFHHLGSGTLAGAATFLSKHFVCNPILFDQEMAALASVHDEPLNVIVSGESRVTTHYDMILNQMAEEARGDKRHGSCGIGFGETIERSERGFPICAADLRNLGTLRAKLRDVRRWLPMRAHELGVKARLDSEFTRGDLDSMDEHFLTNCFMFWTYVHVVDDSWRISGAYHHVVFEGAQGLGLDQDLGSFPHVTRSSTGLPPIIGMAVSHGIKSMEVAYVSRPYATRHGAGPLALESHGTRPCSGASCRTNSENAYQGLLRFGALDIDAMMERISRDACMVVRPSYLKIRSSIALTCLDHIAGDGIEYVDRARCRALSTAEFVERVTAKFMNLGAFCSTGPTRDDVRLHRASSMPKKVAS